MKVRSRSNMLRASLGHGLGLLPREIQNRKIRPDHFALHRARENFFSKPGYKSQSIVSRKNRPSSQIPAQVALAPKVVPQVEATPLKPVVKEITSPLGLVVELAQFLEATASSGMATFEFHATAKHWIDLANQIDDSQAEALSDFLQSRLLDGAIKKNPVLAAFYSNRLAILLKNIPEENKIAVLSDMFHSDSSEVQITALDYVTDNISLLTADSQILIIEKCFSLETSIDPELDKYRCAIHSKVTEIIAKLDDDHVAMSLLHKLRFRIVDGESGLFEFIPDFWDVLSSRSRKDELKFCMQLACDSNENEDPKFRDEKVLAVYELASQVSHIKKPAEVLAVFKEAFGLAFDPTPRIGMLARDALAILAQHLDDEKTLLQALQFVCHFDVFEPLHYQTLVSLLNDEQYVSPESINELERLFDVEKTKDWVWIKNEGDKEFTGLRVTKASIELMDKKNVRMTKILDSVKAGIKNFTVDFLVMLFEVTDANLAISAYFSTSSKGRKERLSGRILN